MVWSFKDLKADVESVWGKKQADDLQLSCTSLSDRWDFVFFHYHEAGKEIARILAEDAAADRALFALLGGLDDDTQSFQEHRHIAAAHTLACLQSFHAITDNLAYVVCLGVGLNLADAKPLDAKNANATSVAKRLAGNPLSDLLFRLVDHDEHRYLSAVVNQSKHRNVVKTAYHVDLTGTQSPPHGLQIVAFERDGIGYPARWLKQFLPAEYTRQQTLMHAIGAELNRQARDFRRARC